MAGSKNVLELHGSIHRNYCQKCGKFYDAKYVKESPGIPICECGGIIKPDVVLYEEGLDSMIINKSLRAISEADMLIIGGTSLVVYPAAGFVDYFRGDHLVVLNKSDLPCAADASVLRQRFARVVSLCAKTGEGLAELTELICGLYPPGDAPRGQLLTNARQADAVSRALRAVSDACAALEAGLTPDAVLTDGEAALEALGELNGKSIREDLVATIFSRFCVGK